MDRTTAASTPGTFGNQRWQARINANPNRPITRAAGTVSPLPSPLANPRSSAMKLSPSTEKPNSLGSWPTRMVRARPFM